MYPAFIDANRRRADQHSALYQNIMIDLVNMGVVAKATVNSYLDYNLPERYIVPANDGNGGSDGDNTPGTDNDNTTGTNPQGTGGDDTSGTNPQGTGGDDTSGTDGGNG